ncbi:MAG: EAL domain-containing protein [Lachnospiraceae bacterium]|nr:EAL domain-containing protein [Lachnospiraceae bacterium]
MNIQVQLCGLAILMVLFFFHMNMETVGFRGTKLFGFTMVSAVVCLGLDILSIIFIVADSGTGGFLSNLVSRLYLASLIWVFFFSFIYTCNDINVLQRSKLTLPLSLIYSVTGSLAALFLPMSFEYSAGITYTYGPAVISTYVFAPLFIVLTLVLTFAFGKSMNSHRKLTVRLWMLIMIAAGVIQLLLPYVLLIGFAISIGMMILFMELENPLSEMDKTINVFSLHTMHDYIRQLYEKGTVFAGVLLINSNEWGVTRMEERTILMEMASFLKCIPRAKVFRGSGNDFALIMPQKYFSDDIIRCIYERFILSWNGHEIRTLIVGVRDSRYANSADEVTQFYQYYRARIENTDERLIFFDEKEAAKLYRAKEIQAQITEALDDDRIEVFYQPIYSTDKKRFVSAEALARIRRPDGSIMMPGEFIPVAEQTGLVQNIGIRVIEKVCEMLNDHPITEIGVEYIEVNLSVSQCENQWLPDDISAITEKYSIPPSQLNLEITETSSIRHRDTVLTNMERLTDKGFSFSLDDFGTGESNLNYIVDMPVHIVKFDRTMTRDYFLNEKTRLVMNSVVEMIRNLKLRIVVEGIEEKDQLDAMTDIGVDYIQGYYFSKPIPLNEFITFIHKNNVATL